MRIIAPWHFFCKVKRVKPDIPLQALLFNTQFDRTSYDIESFKLFL